MSRKRWGWWVIGASVLGGWSPAWGNKTDTVVVTATRLDQARASLQPLIGTTQTRFSRQAIEENPGGDNAGLNNLLLQVPGIAQDSYGQVHIRGDHNNVQYRLDGVALPEGMSVFSQTLATRFAHDMSINMGALPAQYGFKQAGVIDLTTKNGVTDPGGIISGYGGSRGYVQPSFQYGGHWGKWDGFITADALRNPVGIENPTSRYNAIHDLSTQYHVLGHARYTVRPETRISLTAGVANAWYQLPNNPGQQRQFATPIFKDQNITPSSQGVDSDTLNEHQQELTDFAILSWQENHEKWSSQTSAIMRYSSLRYSPDEVGDLVFNGIAQRAARSVMSSGVQNDTTWNIGGGHTLRAGFQAYGERVTNKTDSVVYPIINGEISTVTENIHDGSGKTGALYGVYLQDEWRLTRSLTINAGVRFDGVEQYTHAHQLSPRLSIVWAPWTGGRFHIGYARYMTPPSFENMSSASLNKFVGTSAQPDNFNNSAVKTERDHYFDAGFMQKMTPHWRVGVEAYYKRAKNLLDAGQFGAPIMLSSFNYRKGKVHGYELTTDYTRGPLTLYGNMSWSRAMGKDITSAQWNFDEGDLSYIRQHWVHLDHDQRWTASAGGTYRFFRRTQHPLQLSASMVYGSGLRRDGAVPNGATIPQYVTFNLGVVQRFKTPEWMGGNMMQCRLDVTNLFDRHYQLRDGTGIGVGAPQYGLRRTVMGGMSYEF